MIHLRDIFIKYGDRVLLDHVSLIIYPGDKVGLIGRNGAGKSTLLKVIVRDISPDGGKVETADPNAVGYLTQVLTLDEAITPAEACRTAFSDILALEQKEEKISRLLEASADPDEQLKLAGKLSEIHEQVELAGGSKMEAEIEKVLKGLGFTDKTVGTPIHTLSGGWKMRVELARLLLQRPTFLLLDEPTNHLDIEAIIWLEGYLKSYPGAVLVISHDKTFLNTVTTKTWEVTMGRVVQYSAPYIKAMEMKAGQQEITEAAYQNQQKQIAQKERLIERFRAKASKAAFAKALQKELGRIDRIELDQAEGKSMIVRFPFSRRSGDIILRCDGMSKSFGDNHVIRNLNMQLERGERIAFIGQNGQGKTTLARLITGELEPTSGDIQTGQNIDIGYYAQDQAEQLHDGDTLLEAIERGAPEELRTKLRGILGAFLFSGEDVDKKVKVLSGGERARLALAKMILHASNVLIMDEPTHHLDISSKEILKSALMDYQGCLIVVSHDREFLSGLTQHVLEFKDGVVKKHLVDIDDYLAARQLETMRLLEMKSASKKQIEQKSPKRANNKDFQKLKALRRSIGNLERKIEKLETAIAGYESEMAATDFYDRGDQQQVYDAYERDKGDLTGKMEKWELLQEELEQLDN